MSDVIFFVNQIFIDEYPSEAAIFCNKSNEYYIDEIEPENGHRRFQIKEIPVPTTEELAFRVRSIRDAKLSACDYRMATDVYASMTAGKQQEWVNYRQALRDLPSQEGFPWDGGGELTPFPVEPE